MRAYVRCAVLLMMFASVCAIAANTVADLKAHADSSHGGEQAKLSLEYARVQLEAADKLFTNGDAEQAQSDIQEVVTYARKAANAASSSGKQLKETEIKLRKLADRMHDIGETLAFEDRQPVRDAVEQVQKIRSDLMVKMWGPDAQPKGSS
jgi:hypothetical protein